MGRDDVNWEPYRDAGYEFMGVDVDQQDRWRAVTPTVYDEAGGQDRPHERWSTVDLVDVCPRISAGFQLYAGSGGL
ncbi:hypothetical protein K1719_008072 [Acacia pycnantha]|nr:hypothetical protein K1719_008072 [Acacia pycnantha]